MILLINDFKIKGLKMKEQIENSCRRYIHDGYVTPCSLSNFIITINKEHELNKNINNKIIYILSRNICNKNPFINSNDIIELIKKINDFSIII